MQPHEERKNHLWIRLGGASSALHIGCPSAGWVQEVGGFAKLAMVGALTEYLSGNFKWAAKCSLPITSLCFVLARHWNN